MRVLGLEIAKILSIYNINKMEISDFISYFDLSESKITSRKKESIIKE